jgi:hypothetical protein
MYYFVLCPYFGCVKTENVRETRLTRQSLVRCPGRRGGEDHDGVK